MMSGDGLVVRIRAPLGQLSQDQASAVATLSERFGNGLIDLSARANLQLRGITADSYPALIAALQDLGLVDHDSAAEARRNVMLTPLWKPEDISHRIAAQLEQALRDAEDLLLPGKFGFVVDAGESPQLRDCVGDIRIETSGAELLLLADGAECGQSITAETAAEAALDLARWFLQQGGAPEGRGRMHPLIARRGLPASHITPRSASTPSPTIGNCAIGQLVGLEFGQITAQALATLAEQGALRLTPWRMLLIEGRHDIEIPRLPGLILDARDPRLRVSACTGAPGCLQALSATRDLARDLAPFVPEGQVLHVSGCAKGCAHPRPAPLVLTATAPDTFALIHHGKAGDHPLRDSLRAGALRAAPQILTEGS
ncbi:precorrin-3B synthase [Pseudophaeobacter flagellatus]|uniref:precorrin-3B synthase n=1 Tax=Pseudophaeobacter flagellatus TaxID=2899119 RepID=UPI001E42376D|nr:precorrin-3B synthase [Pseudophaeobacter flagellatus]